MKANSVNNTIRDFTGVRDVKVAKIISEKDGKTEYGEVRKLAGVALVNNSKEVSQETKYYDNQPAFTVSGNPSNTLEIETSVIPLDLLAEIEGNVYDENGVSVGVNGERASFAIVYTYGTTDGNEFTRIYYKGTFDSPDSSHNTKDDGTDSNGQTVTFTVLAPVDVSTVGEKKRVVTDVIVDHSKTDLTSEELTETILTYDELKEALAGK